MTAVQEARTTTTGAGGGDAQRNAAANGQSVGETALRTLARAFGIEVPPSMLDRLLATPSPVDKLMANASGVDRFRAPDAASYTVRPGDTLSAIAERHGQSLGSLLAANPQLASHPDLIHSGETVRLSDAATSTYTVAAGDTLSGIAARHGTDWPTLARLNNLADPDRLAVGQTLRLPGDGATASGPRPATPSEAPRPTARPDATAPVTPVTTPANGIITPGRASVEAARYADQRAAGHPSIGMCYAWVKDALQHSGAVPDHLPGVAAKGAGPALEARGFHNVLGQPGSNIRSPYDAPVGAVLVYGAAPGATDPNAKYGHIEIRTANGFASDYASPRARTGPAESGLEGRGRVLIGVYIKPDARAAAAPRPTTGTAPPAAANDARYGAANLDLGANEAYRADILHAAEVSGLPPQTVAAVISAEAAADGNGRWRADSYNADSGATGLTQFVSGTWLDEARSGNSLLHAELQSRGINPATASDSSLLALRTDARLSIVAGVSYARSNIASLQASGTVPRDLDPAMTAKVAYIAHHEGLGGARAYFSGDIVAVNSKWSSNVPASQQAAYLERAGGDRAQAYHAWLTDYTNTRIDVARFMIDSGGVRAASVATLVR